MMYETFFAEEPRAKDWIQRDVSGLPILLTYGYEQSFCYRPCFSCQEYLDYLKRVVKLAIEWAKTDFIDFDNFVLNAEPDSCHCNYCIMGFRNYLKKKYPPDKRKERLGFEVVDFINPPQWNRTNLPDKMEIIRDPALQEWVDYRCQVMADALEQISTYAKSLNPEVAIEINPHGITGGNRAWVNGIDHRRLMKWTDTLVTEERNMAAYHPDGRLVSKIRSHKLARAFHNTVVPVHQDILDLAESLAFNQTISWVGNWPLSEGFRQYIAFYRKYREYYAGAEDVATVAVYRSYPSITYHNSRCQLSAILVEQALIQARIPFDLIFEDHLAGLSKYRAVVLPDSECLSDAQIGQIRSFVEAGGGLVALGEAGLYDEWRRFRVTPGLHGLVEGQPVAQPDPDSWFDGQPPEPGALQEGGPSVRKEYGSGRVVYIPAAVFDGPLPAAALNFDIGNEFWKRPANWQQIVEDTVWASGGDMPLGIDGPPYLVANLVSQPTRNRAMLHLLNYDHEQTPSIESIPVVWKWTQGESPQRVEVFSQGFDAPQSLRFTIAGSALKFVGPSVRTYAVVAVSW